MLSKNSLLWWEMPLKLSCGTNRPYPSTKIVGLYIHFLSPRLTWLHLTMCLLILAHPDFKSMAMGLAVQEYHGLTRKFIKTVLPPPGITSWTKSVDAVVILDSTSHSWPLLKAAETALGEQLNACNRPDPALPAAVGAAMRALE
jgi:hypothetical protein